MLDNGSHAPFSRRLAQSGGVGGPAGRIVGPGFPEPDGPAGLQSPAPRRDGGATESRRAGAAPHAAPEPEPAAAASAEGAAKAPASSGDPSVAGALHEEARRRRPSETARVGRRLLLVTLLGVVGVPAMMVALAMLEVELPPMVALGLLALVGIGALVSAAQSEDEAGDAEGGERSHAEPEADEGRPIGCCPGPRPLRSFRKR